jgi:hypothetical protein
MVNRAKPVGSSPWLALTADKQPIQVSLKFSLGGEVFDVSLLKGHDTGFCSN